MTSIKWIQVFSLSVSLAACATGGDVRAPNGMVPYESNGDEAPEVSAADVSLLIGNTSPVSRQRTVQLAQSSCVQTQPRYVH